VTSDQEATRQRASELTDLFLQAPNLVAVKRVLDQHPVLLNEYFETELTRAVTALRDKGHHDVASQVQERIDQLQRARELGTAAGILGPIVELLAAAQGSGSARQVVRSMPELLSDDVLKSLVDYASDAQARGEHEAASSYAFVYGLLKDCLEMGIDASFDRHSLRQTDLEAASGLVTQMLSTPPREGRRLIEAQTAVVKTIAESMLAVFGAQFERDGDTQHVRHIARWQEVLRACRERGIDAAFAGLR